LLFSLLLTVSTRCLVNKDVEELTYRRNNSSVAVSTGRNFVGVIRAILP